MGPDSAAFAELLLNPHVATIAADKMTHRTRLFLHMALPSPRTNMV